MKRTKRKDEEESVLCSLNTLTDFCLRECIPAGQGSLLPQVDSCFGSCVHNYIEMRFHTRDKWMEDYSET